MPFILKPILRLASFNHPSFFLNPKLFEQYDELTFSNHQNGTSSINKLYAVVI